MSQIGFFGSGGGGGGGISQINGNTGTVTPSSGIVVIEGGNNINTVGSGDILTVNVSGTTNHAVQIGNSTNSLSSVTVGTTGQVLTGSTGADPAFAALGTNSGLTAHGVLIGEGSSAIAATTPGTTGQVLIGSTGADPAFGALGVNSGLTAHGVLLGEGNSAIGATVAGSTGQVLIGSTGADPAFGALGVNSGLTSKGVVLGNGNSALTATAAGTDGQVFLGSSSVAPAFATLTSTAGSIAYTTGSNALNLDVTNYVTSTSWTPVLTFGGSSSGITYTTQTGYYAQIGHLVIAQFSIILSSKGSQTGNMNITGLNFTLAGSVVNVPVNVYFYGASWSLTATSGNQAFYDGTNIVFNHMTGSTANVATFTNVAFTNTSSCTGTFCFVV